MLEAFIVAVMAFHLLAMNLASAGPVVCIWLRCGSRAGGDLSDRLGRSLAWLSLVAFLLGMLSGVGLVLAPSSPQLLDAIGRFPSRAYWMAGGELLFSLVCLGVYAASWNPLRRRSWLHALIALVGAANLLYHFPPLMIVLGKLSVDPSWTIAAMIDRPAFRELMVRSEVLALTAHFALASLAVAGVAALWLQSRRTEDQNEELETVKTARGPAAIALIASLMQLPVGVWVLASSSSAERSALLGGEFLPSLLLAGGLLATLLLLQRLAAIALGDVEPKNLRHAGWLLIATVLLMTAALRTSRDAQAATQPAAEHKAPRLAWYFKF